MTTKEKCSKCEGLGFIPVPDEDPRMQQVIQRWGDYADVYRPQERCECLLDKRFRYWAGEAVYRAENVETSVLDGKEDKNLFISTPRRTDFLSHLKFILAQKDFSYTWKMTTDAELLDIWLGKSEIHKSVGGFAKLPELLIIQLGVLSYKNVAMPGILLEAIKTREFSEVPTWIINLKGLPFKEGHLSWDMEVEYYIDMHYQQVQLDFAGEVPTTTQKSPAKKKLRSLNDGIDLL